MIDLFSALSLVFILEGFILIVSPKRLKRILELLKSMSEKKIRLLGYVSIIIGIVMLWLIRS